MAELGIIAAKGRNGTAELLQIIGDVADDRIPPVARFCLDLLARQYISAEVASIDKRIHAWHRWCEESRRLEEIPGIGPIVATALVLLALPFLPHALIRQRDGEIATA